MRHIPSHLMPLLPLLVLTACHPDDANKGCAFPEEAATLSHYAQRFECEIYPLMTRNENGCVACHDASSERVMRMGSDGATTFEQLRAGGFLNPTRGGTVLDRVQRSDTLQMPLGGQWSTEDIERLRQFVEALESYSCSEPSPGRVTLHRLNRSEYDFTVRDILNETGSPAADFPVDDSGNGFDNMAEVLSISPLLVEKYWSASDAMATTALGLWTDAQNIRLEAEALGSGSGREVEDGWLLQRDGTMEGLIIVPSPGEYTLRMRAYKPTDSVSSNPWITVTLDGVTVGKQFYPDNNAVVFEVHQSLASGNHALKVAVCQDFIDGDGCAGPLVIDWFELYGPLQEDPPDGTQREEILTCDIEADPSACGTQILQSLALKVWRRPPDTDELSRLLAFVSLAQTQGERAEVGIRLALQCMLLSPHFIFRPEVTNPSASTPISGYALASRLSYFLWSSSPDARLLSLAETGALLQKDTLLQEVDRMLADPRADALVTNFGGQWLYLRNLEQVAADQTLFPEYDDSIQAAMEQETALYFRAFLQEDRSFLDILDAPFTYLNASLATYYDIAPDDIVGDNVPWPLGAELVKVELNADAQRGGILTHGSLQTVTSYPTRTSPVTRGKWVMEQLLCQAPAPPPTSFPPPDESGSIDTSQREQMEAHRSDPACAGCHAYMDPIGFSMENYNAVGQWRTEDDLGFPIDNSGVFPDGRIFHGVGELSQILKADPAVPLCFTQQLFTYALGRAPTPEDSCTLDTLNAHFRDSDYRIKQLVKELVLSEPFRIQGAEK